MAKNKLGICEWSLPVDGPWTCKIAAELGFDGIQLNVGSYERGFSMSRPVVQNAYLEAAEESGIEFCSMAARVSDYYSMVSEPGSEEHEIVRSGIRAAIEACGAMKIPRLLIPNFVKSAITTERHFEIVADVLRWACDLAADAGVTIAAENTLSPSEFRRLLDAVDRSNIGLYFDFQNYFLHNDDHTPKLLEEMYDWVLETHVKDGRNKDLSGALLGEGDASFLESARVLNDRGYDGWIVTENYYDMQPLCGPDGDPMDLMRRDVKTLREVFA